MTTTDEFRRPLGMRDEALQASRLSLQWPSSPLWRESAVLWAPADGVCVWTDPRDKPEDDDGYGPMEFAVEAFVILEGDGTYRHGDQQFPVRAGDVCAAPAGPGAARAHQLINTGSTTLRYLGLSTKIDTEVVEYPDSGKFGVISHFDWGDPQAGGIRFIGRVNMSLDYFDGEE